MPDTTTLSLNSALSNGDTVFKWLGSFWKILFQDDLLIRRYTGGQGLLSSQLYLDFLETLNLYDRNTVPVFHRERWRMLVLKESQRNTGDAASLQLGGTYTPVVGPQSELPFQLGTTYLIGGSVVWEGATTYPLGDPSIAGIATAVTDDIVKPTKVLMRDVDFRIDQNTIIFLNNNDPFSLGFPVRSVVADDGTQDREVAIWVVDALFDKDYVYNFIGYVLQMRDKSSDFYAKYLNALWDMYNSGTSLAMFQSGIAAILDEPSVLEDAETIVTILYGDNIQVITDKNVYKLHSTSSLHPKLQVGSVLQKGDLLSDTIRIYNNIDPSRLSAGNDAARLQDDINALFLTPGFFRTKLRYGLGLSWQLEDITYHGNDANGNPKLSFTVYGDDADIQAFWQDFWQYCELNHIDGKACFDGHLHARLLPVDGAVWGSVSPLEYFLYQFLKANMLFIAVDSAKLSLRGRQSMYLLGALRQVIPAHVCFLVVDRQTVSTETYDVGAMVTDDAVPALAHTLSDTAGANEYSKIRLAYKDAAPLAQLIPICYGDVK